MLSTIEFKDNNEDFITTFKKIVLEKIQGSKVHVVIAVDRTFSRVLHQRNIVIVNQSVSPAYHLNQSCINNSEKANFTISVFGSFIVFFGRQLPFFRELIPDFYHRMFQDLFPDQSLSLPDKTLPNSVILIVFKSLFRFWQKLEALSLNQQITFSVNLKSYAA